MLRARAERLKRQWTQHDVSVRTGIHPSDISKLELGMGRCPAHVERLAEVFGVDPEQLLEEAELEIVAA
ncbi:MAG: helix-turn-helix domain-containing protein [Gammaproteobacteria bacterium]